jgi:hypothetical protein
MSATRLAYKQPRPATAIAGQTGEEIVLEARERGRVILVSDALGRLWERVRADSGWWTRERRPCDACGVPTHERVWHVYGPHWTAMHHRAGCER